MREKQRVTARGLNRGKSIACFAIVAQNEMHAAVAQEAHAVEDEDRTVTRMHRPVPANPNRQQAVRSAATWPRYRNGSGLAPRRTVRAPARTSAMANARRRCAFPSIPIRGGARWISARMSSLPRRAARRMHPSERADGCRCETRHASGKRRRQVSCAPSRWISLRLEHPVPAPASAGRSGSRARRYCRRLDAGAAARDEPCPTVVQLTTARAPAGQRSPSRSGKRAEGSWMGDRADGAATHKKKPAVEAGFQSLDQEADLGFRRDDLARARIT